MKTFLFTLLLVMVIGCSVLPFDSQKKTTNKMPDNFNNTTKIVYVFDALCGWCYGFSPVIKQLHENYADKFDFTIVSGGLSVENPGPINEVAPYIKAGAYKTVEEKCGVKFGDAFINGTLKTGDMILNSLPPAIALAIVKEQMPSKAFAFGTILHKAIYVDGHQPEDIEGYGKYAAKIGLDPVQFVSDMSKENYEKVAYNDFSIAKQYGVVGFPSLVAVKKDTSFIINNGYNSYDKIAAVLDQL